MTNYSVLKDIFYVFISDRKNSIISFRLLIPTVY